MNYEIDAQNKILGRLAAQIATKLRGKDAASFEPNKASQNKLVIINVSKIKVSGKKLDQKFYYRHSGFPGGLKAEKLRNLMEKNPGKALLHAIRGMLPRNRLRSRLMKNLSIKE